MDRYFLNGGALKLLIVAAVFISGCAQTAKQPLYRWGSYEPLIYKMYIEPGKAEPGEQVTTLSADIAKTTAEGKRVPPGVHAHLGYMYFNQGLENQARAEFVTERELYPESRVFVDRMITRLESEK